MSNIEDIHGGRQLFISPSEDHLRRDTFTLSCGGAIEVSWPRTITLTEVADVEAWWELMRRKMVDSSAPCSKPPKSAST